MSQNPIVNITQVIDRSPVGVFQIRTFALCAVSLIMAGVDAQALGYVGPELIREWGIEAGNIGQIVGITSLGVLVGSLVFAIVADKIGRRPVLILSTFLFGVLTLMAARADSLEEMLLLRFFGGIPIGSIIPNTTALIGELSPHRKRVTLMMSITVGFTVGGGLAAIIAWLLIPYGWRNVLYLGGAIPILAALLMYLWLPESLGFLVLKGKNLNQVGAWIRQINPTTRVDTTTRYSVSEDDRGGVPMVHLFREGRAVTTSLLWLINFLNLLNLYFLVGMLPTVLTERAGFESSTAALVATPLQIGGVIGTFGLAWLIAQKRFVSVLTLSFLVASISIIVIGTETALTAVPVLVGVVFVAGWCIIGGQPGLNSMAASYYPTSMRSTGVGFCLGIGRFGAILGPPMWGWLIDRELSNEQIFLLAGAIALLTGAVMFSLGWTMRLEPIQTDE